ncbi:phosphoribosylanthranilate isomerase [Halanaerobium salsuginis]|uniref:N-(5'-phosphoribosyl)anthranilate isomerase n=1 Tax=Halanaerobium salsuginis TaxID=29563 RepID=A0A1I4M6H6_9FIRM|nr:phosphoribosylanthranilate isomerase [Halanaerobium salsuginis]SFL98693.1 phosphoribosylanthranilate isomerase [Halanaerobium salsuginis]
MKTKKVMVKVCGLQRKSDLLYAVKLGVDALGFILADSPRQVSIKKVKKITTGLPPFVIRVAVVVNPSQEKLIEIIESQLFDYIQFHGQEDPDLLRKVPLKTIKAIPVAKSSDLKLVDQYREAADYLLFDTKAGQQTGGTGKTFNWQLLAQQEFEQPFILAGGLGADNIETALQQVKPAAVDINSKIETSPGIKSNRLLEQVITKIRNFQVEKSGKLKLKFI